MRVGGEEAAARKGWGYSRTIVSALVMSAGMVLPTVLIRPDVIFSGDASAAGARVYVDGVFIGRMSGGADSIVAGSVVYRPGSSGLERSVQRGKHSLTFVSRAGDTLRSKFVPRGVSLVSVSFFTRTIVMDPPLHRDRRPPMALDPRLTVKSRSR